MEKNKSFSIHIMGYKPSNLLILHFKLWCLQKLPFFLHGIHTIKPDLISRWLVLHSELTHSKDYHQNYNYCWQLQYSLCCYYHRNPTVASFNNRNINLNTWDRIIFNIFTAMLTGKLRAGKLRFWHWLQF
jgi:hypothetical protein